VVLVVDDRVIHWNLYRQGAILGLWMLRRFTGGKWRAIHLVESEIPFIDPPAFSDTIPEICEKSPSSAE